MRTRRARLPAVGACALALALLSSAGAAAGETAPRPVGPARHTGPSGVEAAIRRYLGVSAGTRVIVAAPVVRGDHASVSVERYAGPLAGEGETLVLDRVDGRWRVVAAAGPDWVNWSGVSRRPGA